MLALLWLVMCSMGRLQFQKPLVHICMLDVCNGVKCLIIPTFNFVFLFFLISFLLPFARTIAT